MSKNKNKPNSSPKDVIAEKVTLPWLIITICSMVSFFAFLIAMFFQFYTSVFFGVFILTIAAEILLDGIHKRKENHLSGNMNLIMAVLCAICAVVVMNM